jgi:hypothetical protein
MGSCQSGDVIELKPEDDDYNYKEKKIHIQQIK